MGRKIGDLLISSLQFYVFNPLISSCSITLPYFLNWKYIVISIMNLNNESNLPIKKKYFKRTFIKSLFMLFLLTITLFIGFQVAIKKLPGNSCDVLGNSYRKPIIYLYPEISQQVQVEISVNGTITKSIPEYEHGWDLFVEPNG